MQDQDARRGRVVQAGPGRLDFGQLPQAVLAKAIGGAFAVRLRQRHAQESRIGRFNVKVRYVTHR